MSNKVIGYKMWLTQDNESGGGGGGLPTTGLILDLDPEYECYKDHQEQDLCTDGELVQEWHDQSGFMYVYGSQTMYGKQSSEAERPTWREGDPNRNNKPYVEFDEDGAYMSMRPYSGAYKNNSGQSGFENITTYIVCDPDVENVNATSGGWLLCNTDNAYYGEGWFINQKDDGDVQNRWEVSTLVTGDFEDTRTPDGIASVYSTVIKAATLKSDREFSHRYATGTTPSSKVPSPVNTYTNGLTPDWQDFLQFSYTLICNGYSGSTPSSYGCWIGKIFRILMYKGAHDSTTQSNIMTSLANTYNL